MRLPLFQLRSVNALCPPHQLLHYRVTVGDPEVVMKPRSASGVELGD